MKQGIMFLLLAAGLSPPALADLVAIYRYSDAEVYADTSSIERVKDKAAMWSLTDSRIDKEFLGSRYRSQRTLVEYDCAKMTSLAVEWRYYRGQMGRGELAGTYPPVGHFPGYQPLPLMPDTPEGVAWKIACEKR